MHFSLDHYFCTMKSQNNNIIITWMTFHTVEKLNCCDYEHLYPSQRPERVKSADSTCVCMMSFILVKPCFLFWPHTSGRWATEDTLCDCSSPPPCCPRPPVPCPRTLPTAGCHSYRPAAGQRCPAIGWAAAGSAGSLPPPLGPVTPGRLAPGPETPACRPDREPGAASDRLWTENKELIHINHLHNVCLLWRNRRSFP